MISYYFGERFREGSIKFFPVQVQRHAVKSGIPMIRDSRFFVDCSV